jgi:outer membrane receptor protein involved in Fe transport
MGSKTALRAACLVGTALVMDIGFPAPSIAQSETAATYDLPPQDLGETLRAIGRVSGREILFSADAVEGRTAPAIKGRLLLGEALGHALAGTTLVVEYRAGAVLIHERRPLDAASSSALQPADSTIVVTGTRIRGNGSASPVIVTSREALEQAGAHDLVGFARMLPQNYTGGQNPGVAGGGEQGGQENANNSAALNLRGLGPDATLTLLNGHRLAYDGLGQGIDISAIPLTAVDRIDVIADGASALYGSDAVAGVANIILRRDFDGLETTVRAGASTDGGNVQQQYSLVGGQRWSDGGFMLTLDHSRASPIHADQRSYTRDLDPSMTLLLRTRQTSAVVTGHQRLTAGVGIDVDGYWTKRRSRKQTPFVAGQSALFNGLVNSPDVESYAITPTLRIDLPGRWLGSISATRAENRSLLHVTQYFDGTALPSRLTYRNRTNGADFNAEGPLFRLPGGEARLAIGGGLRRVSLHDNITDIFPDHVSVFRDFTEARSVQFAYGELSAPLVRPELEVPLVRHLSVTGAVRYERWKGIDSVATPKFGILYEPRAGVTFRATWGQSFKAPTLDQIHKPLQGYLLPGFVFSPQPDPPLPAGAGVLLLGGGNPELGSERATTWSAAIEVEPRLIDGLRISASYFHVDYRDRIVAPLTGTLSALTNPLYQDLIILGPTVDQVNDLVASFPEGLVNQTGQPFDPAIVGAVIDDSLRNAARQKIRGVDLSADYRLDLPGEQKLLFSGSASYLRSHQQLTVELPSVAMAGVIFNPPHWRGRASAMWQSHTADLSASLNYVGTVRDNRVPPVRKIGPFVTLDLNLSVHSDKRSGALSGLELRLSALNILNEKPDRISNPLPTSVPYDSTNQSPVGRFIGASLRKAW